MENKKYVCLGWISLPAEPVENSRHLSISISNHSVFKLIAVEGTVTLLMALREHIRRD
jgi:hypothetical protein